MVTTLILLFIAIFDFKKHRIPNLAIVLLAIVGWFDTRHCTNLFLGLVTLAIGFLSFRFFNVGAGDIKLLTVLFVFLIPTTSIGSFWIYFSLISLLLTISIRLSIADHRGHIPLAPALCGAVLCVIGLGLLARGICLHVAATASIDEPSAARRMRRKRRR